MVFCYSVTKLCKIFLKLSNYLIYSSIIIGTLTKDYLWKIHQSFWNYSETLNWSSKMQTDAKFQNTRTCRMSVPYSMKNHCAYPCFSSIMFLHLLALTLGPCQENRTPVHAYLGLLAKVFSQNRLVFFNINSNMLMTYITCIMVFQ